MTTNDDTDTVLVIIAGGEVITVPGSSGQPTCTYRKLRVGEITMGPDLTPDEANEFIVSSANPNTFLYLVTCAWPNGELTYDYTWITETSPPTRSPEPAPNWPRSCPHPAHRCRRRPT
ncbi:MAG: hypothetical protein R2770_15055 [Acidimicrobiales bacterium]